MLVLAVCGVGPSEGSTGELAEPASLAEQLRGRLDDLKGRIDIDWCLPASPEAIGGVRAVLDLVVSGLSEFCDDNVVCEQILERGRLLRITQPRNYIVKDYAELDQDQYTLYRLGQSYFGALDRIRNILGLWWKNKLGCLEALANFLGLALRLYGWTVN